MEKAATIGADRSRGDRVFMEFIKKIEEAEGVFILVNAVADIFDGHIADKWSEFNRPLVDGMFNFGGGELGFVSCQELVCRFVVEVNEGIGDVFFTVNGTGA